MPSNNNPVSVTDAAAEKAINATASRAWWRTRRTGGGAGRGANGVNLIFSTPLVLPA